jgi:hypothetical protein
MHESWSESRKRKRLSNLCSLVREEAPPPTQPAKVQAQESKECLPLLLLLLAGAGWLLPRSCRSCLLRLRVAAGRVAAA